VDEYRSFRRDLEERVGRINGACGTVHSLPMHYVRGSVSREDLVALYAAADVMLVTPLRDGMNLVAKEFVASRIDDDGVLVLSEFAGAAAELNAAMTVNPYDVDAVATVLHRALHAPEPERRARMRDLRRQVTRCDAQAWTRNFLDRLVQPSTTSPSRRIVRPGPSLITTLDTARSALPLRLLLEYEGTLVPLTRSSGLSPADDELMDLLNQLAALPYVRLDIVSRRPPAMLDACLGSLSASRWAERGLWHRPHPGASWTSVIDVPPEWMTRVAPILDQFTATTPGSHVEAGTASLAWHYRGVPRDFGARQAHELRMLLGDILSNQPLEVLEGRKFIEVRLRGVSSRHVAHRVADAAGPAGTVVAIGGECMDEELFRALP
jgi:trehalose 6-phosphate synthase/phosphatase